ncbi:extracellular metalloproteinase, serralysin family, putative [Pseudomonas synxantha]|uniref:Extracellular metalloproteinase, serralysin family, putative n=1 Tax=Pseudomonas synxantha TaxID=47883 RepID=A0A3G7U798_9PSED|nr:M10 family metallopeptidase C-terminal domain-containing protein [Pseudomonas synxantha]AZE55244.1 extracellular metalloproteinase, serralysin family, putative [Pseudomonas synxantha]
MSSIQSLPTGGTWTQPEDGHPVLRGTDQRERLEARRGEPSVLIGGGGADQLVGRQGENTFKYEQSTDSLSDDPDTILNFNPKEDEIDVSWVLKDHNISAINIQSGPPVDVGDVQLSHEFGVSTLNIKVAPEGPNFSVRVDGVNLLPEHINFFHSD